ITDTLPAGVTFVSATSGQATCTQASGVVDCDAGTVAIGNTSNQVTVTIVVIPTVTGTITNVASVYADEIDVTPANNTASAVSTVQARDLRISKFHTGSFVAGQQATYTITVTNTGTAAVAPVTVTDVLP